MTLKQELQALYALEIKPNKPYYAMMLITWAWGVVFGYAMWG